ncbi:MAG: hypothetical protein KDD68_20215 [Bdellovibrionales bacterium]|nr:hypothetical protein [Bdellovibrionales bacterium]
MFFSKQGERLRVAGLVLITLILASVLLPFQNCGQTSDSSPAPLEKDRGSEAHLSGGNGGGYLGKFAIASPESVGRGTEIEVLLVGGSEPYTLQTDNAGIHITPIAVGRYRVSVDSDYAENHFTLIATEGGGSRASKTIVVIGKQTEFNYVDPHGVFHLNDRIVVVDGGRPDTPAGSLKFYSLTEQFMFGVDLSEANVTIVGDTTLADDKLFILDRNSGDVVIFGRSGLIEGRIFNDNHKGNGEQHVAIAVADQRVFTLERTSGTIKVVGLGGGSQISFGHTSYSQFPAVDLDVDSRTGEVFVLDGSKSNVKVFDFLGNHLRSFQELDYSSGERFQNPGKILVAKGGRILVSGSDTVTSRDWFRSFVERRYPSLRVVGFNSDGSEYTNNGELVLKEAFKQIKCFIPMDDSQVVFLCHGNDIYEWDLSTGKAIVLKSFLVQEQELLNPGKVVAGSNGDFFVVTQDRDTGVNDIRHMLSDGTDLGSVDVRMGERLVSYTPYDVWFSSNELFVLDGRENKVLVFDSEGKIRSETSLPVLPSDFRTPSKLTVVGNLIYVLNISNSHLLVWDRNSGSSRVYPLCEVPGQYCPISSRPGLIYSQLGVDPLGRLSISDSLSAKIYQYQADTKGIELVGAISLENTIGPFRWRSPREIVFLTRGGVGRITDGDPTNLEMLIEEGFSKGQVFEASSLDFLSNGSLVVSDTGNQRIQIFSQEFFE